MFVGGGMRINEGAPVSALSSVVFPGFTPSRVLWVKDRSELLQGVNKEGKVCVLKVLTLEGAPVLERFRTIRCKLAELMPQSGLIPLRSFGIEGQRYGWQEFPLADNLLVSKEGDKSGPYQSTTLDSQLSQRGRVPADQLLLWLRILVQGLGALHRAGLIHRDIKPSNILFVGGKPCLGDYELVSPPGWETQLAGTEGFKPLEGTDHNRSDVFALGRTLYVAWTGRDRLEFPRGLATAEGRLQTDRDAQRLEMIIAGACGLRAHAPIASTEDLEQALKTSLHNPFGRSRRVWLKATAASVGLLIGASALFKARSTKAYVGRWTSCGRLAASMDDWNGQVGNSDSPGRTKWFVRDNKGVLDFRSLDLVSLEMTSWSAGFVEGLYVASFLNRQRDEFLLVEPCLGRVLVVKPELKQLKQLGRKPVDERRHTMAVYWNPIQERLGVFGGYGEYATRNDRHEFDPRTETWMEVEPHQPGRDPWPRYSVCPPIVDRAQKRMFLFGGHGSPSGRQGERFPGLTRFEGHFYALDDIWEHQFDTGLWKPLLRCGTLGGEELMAAAYHPLQQGFLLLTKLAEKRTTTNVWLFRPGADNEPIPIRGFGNDLGTREIQGWAMDPATHELVVIAGNEVFRMRLEVDRA